MENNSMPNDESTNETNDDFSPSQTSADEMIKRDFSPNERRRWAEKIFHYSPDSQESQDSPESPKQYESNEVLTTEHSPKNRNLKAKSESPKDLNAAVLTRYTGKQRKDWAEIIFGADSEDEEDSEEDTSPEKTIVKESSPPEKTVSHEESEPIYPEKASQEKETSPPETEDLPVRAKTDREWIFKPKAHVMKTYRSGTKPVDVKQIPVTHTTETEDFPIQTINKVKKYLHKLSEHQLVLEECIHIGSYGFVVEATYMNEKKVAVKIIDKDEPDMKYGIDPIESDIRIFSQLKQKNIINLMNSINESNVIFLVMPLADSDLYIDIYNNGAVCEYRAKDWFLQIATGLEYMHENLLAHRDIKLDNILVMGNTLKICDFDLCVKLNEKGKPINIHINYMKGTLCYMAPELLTHQTPRDLRLADVWSLGITLFAMMTYTYAYGYIPGNMTTSVSNMRANRYKYPEECIPTQECQNIQAQLLEFDHLSRMSIKQILAHQWFKTESIVSDARNIPKKCSHSLNADINTGHGNYGQSDGSDRHSTSSDTRVVNQ